MKPSASSTWLTYLPTTVACHFLQVVEQRQGDNLHYPQGREVVERHADDTRGRGLHLQSREEVPHAELRWHPDVRGVGPRRQRDPDFPDVAVRTPVCARKRSIVPEAIWSKVKDPTTYNDPNPVATGPYTLQSFTPQGFTLVKNPNYWQPGEPKVDRIYWPAYDSNTASLTALVSGEADCDTNYLPGLQRSWIPANPAKHHLFNAQVGGCSA